MAFLRRHAVLGCGALVLLASARIVATYPVFNHTIDEPAHIACGMEWLQKHVYQMEPQHPPLARVLSAIGPYLDGTRLPGTIVSMYHAGAVELYSEGRYWRRLTLARLGILPLFWIACAFVFLWARRYYGSSAAILAVLLFSFLPPILAHASLATTDMAVTAFTIGAFYWTLVFAEHPNFKAGLLLGVTAALAVLSKFSALAFLPVTVGAVAIIYIWLERPRARAIVLSVRSWIPPLAAAAAAAVLIVWAAYMFSYGPSGFGGLSLPAPEFFRGLGSAGSHFEKGHPAYLFGEHSQLGWWYYYFVILAVKTPLPFLVLLGVGAFVSLWRVRRAWIPFVFSASILVFTMFNRINIGTRHILPVYAGFAIVAALGALELLKARLKWAIAIGAVCLAWFAMASALSHPDYLAYTNVLAGDAPEQILADSDLDWGQDMDRLGRRLRELGASQVALAPFILCDYRQHGIPVVTESQPQYPAVGWNAVSITVWKVTRMGLYDKYPDIRLWPDLARPRERVGKSMLLYYFPPAR